MFTGIPQLLRMHTKSATGWSGRHNAAALRQTGVVAGLMLLLVATGCATHQARPLALNAPRSQPATLQVASDRVELKLVTFNVWGLPWWINGASSGRFTRIAGELERLNPDFATLQEVWTRKAARSAATTNNWWTAKVARSHLFFQRSGLVTLSRYPIIGGGFHPFHNARLPDALVSKGALKTTIELEPGVRVNLWNVHLQSGESAIAERSRNRQVDELAAWVAAADDGQVADLVAGDFNCEPGSPPYQRLQEHIGAGALELSRSRPLYTFDGKNPAASKRLALDHVIIRLRQPVEFTCANPTMAFTASKAHDRLSDHCGMQVGFSFAPVLNITERGQPLLLTEGKLFTTRAPDVAIPFANSTSDRPPLPH